jgi:hypothetical protein
MFFAYIIYSYRKKKMEIKKYMEENEANTTAQVGQQSQEPVDSIKNIGYMDSLFQELPEVMIIGERPIVKAEQGKLVYDVPRLVGNLPVDNAYDVVKVTKDKINRRGYGKFLKIDNDVRVSLCQDKIDEDEKWDGLKGYVTNTLLPPEEVVTQYHGLWVVERAFRISKGTIETRPIFHFTERRIEAHVCLCFVAYKVYKELERIVAELKLEMSGYCKMEY